MKKILLLLSVFITAFSFSPSINEVIKAFKSGNAAEVSKYFDNTVEITFPEKSNSYNKSQAELVLNDFFATNTVKDFEILHQSDNGGSEYCIGNLQTTGGVFRTTIFMKQKAGKNLIQELRFEK
jgi:antitoxin component YwqK of YwqJK toxin-antitoxin module